MARYYFENDVPGLEEVCAAIQEKYHSKVEVEFHSCQGNMFEGEKEEEVRGLKKMFKATMGINQDNILVQHAVLKSNGEEIVLHTYTSLFKHIDLDSCHTTKTFELYEFAGRVLEQFGGKVQELTEQEIKKLKKGTYLSLLLSVCKLAVLAVLYFCFHLTVLQLFGVVVLYLIIKNVLEVVSVHKKCKKIGWL